MGTTRPLPVIALCGVISDEELGAVRDLGVRACLRKPFRISRLLKEIQQALASRHVA